MSQTRKLTSPEPADDDDALEEEWNYHYQELCGSDPQDVLDEENLLIFSADELDLTNLDMKTTASLLDEPDVITAEIPYVEEAVSVEATTAEIPIVTKHTAIMMIRKRAQKHVAHLLSNKHHRRISYGTQTRPPVPDANGSDTRILGR